jgi:CheY-like chemotaxis protein
MVDRMKHDPRRGSLDDEIAKILIIDDSPSARKLIQQLLLRIGYQLPSIRIAATPQEAIVIFTQWRPNVVFLDLELKLPADAVPAVPAKEAVTGADLAFLFLERNPEVKIVVCSASDPEETRVRELVRVGTIQAMVKPLIAGKVLETLSSLRVGPIPSQVN